jgi:lincosamide nucleotidyltransferase A/C/D/E
VIGGWGVDALVARRTRAHHDLDLFVEAAATDRAVAALELLGFRIGFTWSENRWSTTEGRLVPSAFVAIDATGREIDVHTVEVLAGAVSSRSASVVVLPQGALEATGTIGGRPVPCASVAAQLVMHTGYDVPERQRADVDLLRRLSG